MINVSSKENIQDSEMTQGENKEVIKYDKSKKYSDWTDKTLLAYKDKEKIEDEKVIIIMFGNETKIDF